MAIKAMEPTRSTDGQRDLLGTCIRVLEGDTSDEVLDSLAPGEVITRRHLGMITVVPLMVQVCHLFVEALRPWVTRSDQRGGNGNSHLSVFIQKLY